MTKITDEYEQKLKSWAKKARKTAKDLGLDPHPNDYIVAEYYKMNEAVAYGGMPQRYPHWRWGMAYDQMRKMDLYNMGHIYEIVINSDPTLAYLHETNSEGEQKLVISHVLAHSDFFYKNIWLEKTTKNAIEMCRRHCDKVHDYMEENGTEKVESFIDKVLSIEQNIGFLEQFRKIKSIESEREKIEEYFKKEKKVKGKGHIDDLLLERKEKVEEEYEQRLDELKQIKPPLEPHKDLLGFIAAYSDELEDWQRDIVEIIREESYYFFPHRLTQIINEGWAAFIHPIIMEEGYGDFTSMDDLIELAEHDSRTHQKAQINPYKLGRAIFEDIKKRWDEGKYGKEWEEEERIEILDNWEERLIEEGLEEKLNQGWKKVLEVRENLNDHELIQRYLTDELIEKLELFKADYSAKQDQWFISSRDPDEVRKRLIFRGINGGKPLIDVADSDYNEKGELLLIHRHNGIDLNIEKAKETLKRIYDLWGNPVRLFTLYQEIEEKLEWVPDTRQKLIKREIEEKPVEIKYDGKKIKERKLKDKEAEEVKIEKDLDIKKLLNIPRW